MRAVVIEQGEVIVIEHEDPSPGPGEVIVAVTAAGVNAADLLQRRGLYPAPAGAPADIPGLELAGIVAELGEGVSGIELGSRVMAVVAGGGQAERCAVHASHLLAVPDSVSDLAAGGFPEAFSTAHDAVVTRGRLEAGMRLLVTGAAGGVGSAAVQIGRALGAEVIASVRDPARRAAVEALGASRAVNPEASSLSGGLLSALAAEARILVIGVGGGARLELNLLELMAVRASIAGATLRARSTAEKALVAEGVQRDLLGLLASGALEVPILETFALEDVAAAYERFAAGSKLGKIILGL
jgi:NADPH:quinone reductase-like Zn-dependent oxidoreductase